MTKKVSSNSKVVMLCVTCEGRDNVTQCPILGMSIAPMEQVDFVSGGV